LKGLISVTLTPRQSDTGILKEIAAELKPFQIVPRTFLEDKGVTLTYHFRLLEAGGLPI